jgi:hypothetical protein
MTQEDRMEVCRHCKYRKKDMQRGLVCALTNEKADFDEFCTRYIQDVNNDDVYRREKRQSEMHQSSVNMIIGIIVSAIGVFATLRSYLNAANNDTNHYYIYVGLIITGILIFRTGGSNR